MKSFLPYILIQSMLCTIIMGTGHLKPLNIQDRRLTAVDRMGLHGKVKSVTEINCTEDSADGKWTAQKGMTTYTYYTFSTTGKLIAKLDTSDYGAYTHYAFKYTPDGDVSAETSTDDAGKTTTLYTYNSKGYLIEEKGTDVTELEGAKGVYKTVYTYNNDGTIATESNFLGTQLELTNKYTYNIWGDSICSPKRDDTLLHHDVTEYDFKTYRYPLFDKQGNWLKQTQELTEGSRYVIIRKITYYN